MQTRSQQLSKLLSLGGGSFKVRSQNRRKRKRRQPPPQRQKKVQKGRESGKKLQFILAWKRGPEACRGLGE